MPCYHVKVPGAGPLTRAIVCGKLGAPCRDCGGVGGFLCDFPVAGKTCDRPMCADHATQVGPNRHYCRIHKDRATGDLFARPAEATT